MNSQPWLRVIGVDMTEQQLDIARRHVDGQMERFGFAEPNVRFAHGFIEDLAEVGIDDASVDVVIALCALDDELKGVLYDADDTEVDVDCAVDEPRAAYMF